LGISKYRQNGEFVLVKIMKDNSRSRVIAPVIFKLGGRWWWWAINFKPRSLYPRDYLDILEERKKNSCSTGLRTLDCPARNLVTIPSTLARVPQRGNMPNE
jgi:hypothetical protein